MRRAGGRQPWAGQRAPAPPTFGVSTRPSRLGSSPMHSSRVVTAPFMRSRTAGSLLAAAGGGWARTALDVVTMAQSAAARRAPGSGRGGWQPWLSMFRSDDGPAWVWARPAWPWPKFTTGLDAARGLEVPTVSSRAELELDDSRHKLPPTDDLRRRLHSNGMLQCRLWDCLA